MTKGIPHHNKKGSFNLWETCMKFILSLLIAFASFSTLASPIPFFQCSGFEGKQEFKVGINLVTQKAAFFDGDTITILKLIKSSPLETHTQMLYEGKDMGAPDALLQLSFMMDNNLLVNWASLKSTDITNGAVTDLGTTKCGFAETWEETEN